MSRTFNELTTEEQASVKAQLKGWSNNALQTHRFNEEYGCWQARYDPYLVDYGVDLAFQEVDQSIDDELDCSEIMADATTMQTTTSTASVAFNHLARASSWEDRADRAMTAVVRGFALGMASMHERLAKAAFGKTDGARA